MNMSIAEKIAWSAIKASSMLSSTVPEFKESLSAEDRKVYGRKIALICAQISEDVLNPIFIKYPDLMKKIQDEIENQR